MIYTPRPQPTVAMHFAKVGRVNSAARPPLAWPGKGRQRDGAGRGWRGLGGGFGPAWGPVRGVHGEEGAQHARFILPPYFPPVSL